MFVGGLIIWVVLALVIGSAARARGRSPPAWFFASLLLSPVIAGLLLVIFPDRRLHDLLENMGQSAAVDDSELKRNIRRSRR
jgi:hypothetical protein